MLMATGRDGRDTYGNVKERALEGAEDAKEKVEQVGWVQRLVAAHKELTASGVSVPKVATFNRLLNEGRAGAGIH